MRQSTIIFGTLLTAFVVYITLRGQLPDYLALFTGGLSGGGEGSSSSTNTTNNSSAKDEPSTDPYSLDNLLKQLGLDGKGWF